jgi:hypothetical protein
LNCCCRIGRHRSSGRSSNTAAPGAGSRRRCLLTALLESRSCAYVYVSRCAGLGHGHTPGKDLTAIMPPSSPPPTPTSVSHWLIKIVMYSSHGSCWFRGRKMLVMKGILARPDAPRRAACTAANPRPSNRGWQMLDGPGESLPPPPPPPPPPPKASPAPAPSPSLQRGRTPIVVGGTGFYLRWFVLGRPSTPASSPQSESKAQARLDQVGGSFQGLGGAGIHQQLVGLGGEGEDQQMKSYGCSLKGRAARRAWESKASRGEQPAPFGLALPGGVLRRACFWLAWQARWLGTVATAA